MKKIKFKAWSKWSEQMFTVNELNIKNMFVNCTAKDWTYNIWMWEDEFILLQYTWLKDYKWNEIYEWDLLSETKEVDEYADENTFYECMFNDRLARYWFYSHFHQAFITNFNLDRLQEMIIRWNIYENTNLLKD